MATFREEVILQQLEKTKDKKRRENLEKRLEEERSRSRRPGNLVPPLNKLGETLPLDRETELAIEFLQQHRPMVGRKQLEWSTFHRQLLQEAAKKRGWVPPQVD